MQMTNIAFYQQEFIPIFLIFICSNGFLPPGYSIFLACPPALSILR